MLKYKVIVIVTQDQDKKIKSLALTIKNIKIDNKIIIGYSNLSNLFSTINLLEELRTKSEDKSINILKII